MSLYANNNGKVRFNPVQCTEDMLKQLAPTPGYLYLTTDTKKIYLGTQKEKLPMCATSGFFYGTKEIEPDNSGNEISPYVEFYFNEIEGEDIPEVDDLILNVDGCFYRIQGVDKESEVLETKRLTLQGTGTGGGGSGGGGSASSLRINHVNGKNKYFPKNMKEAKLGVIAFSSDTTNYISSVTCSLDADFSTILKSDDDLNHPMETPYYIDLTKQLQAIEDKNFSVHIRVSDKYGDSVSIRYNVSLISLSITSNVAPLLGIQENSYSYRCQVGANESGLTSRSLVYSLYSKNSATPVYSVTEALESNQSGTVSKTLTFTEVPHGDYTLIVKLVGVASGITIESNELTHKVIIYKESIGTPLFSALIPEDTQQYTTIPISYLLMYAKTQSTYTLNILLDNESITTQSISSGTVQSYDLLIDKMGKYNLKFIVNELGIEYIVPIEITKYEGTLPVININRDDLKVYLTARGRTNDAINKNVWPDYKTPSMEGVLENFYYRTINGWLKDSQNNELLRVNQKAKVSFDAYSPYSVDAKENGLTLELDFVLSGVHKFNKPLIQCVSLDAAEKPWTGFIITGDTFKYYASGNELVSLNLVQNKRIKLSYVIEPSDAHKYPMCYAYLNGIISNAVNYGEDDYFVNAKYPGYLKIDSEFGDIDIYNIRFYSSALDAATILNNYQATLETLDARQASYERNLIRNINGDIDLEAIEDKNYDLQLPYVKITGGYQINKDKITGNMVMANKSDSNVPALPVGKKDYRAIDLELHYPTEKQNPYFKGYKDLTITTKFKNSDSNVLDAFGETLSEGAWMYAQGTSSLEYPVKNIRVKVKGSHNKFIVRPDLTPVNLVTFKADFMESSGSHNTGAANFIDTAYSYAGLATPGQKQFTDETIVTCIKGHPCAIFWSATGEKGTYQYIGKYNLNLDKGTPEPFGFKEDPNDETFGFLTKEDGSLDLDANGNKQNSIYCFEFLDNNEKVCNFKSDAESACIDYDVDSDKKLEEYEQNSKTEQERFRDTWYSTRINEDKEKVPGWARGFESRHPEDKIDTHDADALWPLASWINDLYTIRYIDGNESLALQRFKDEYQEYLDPEFLLAYYVITEALLMADSRVKNMMIATWGKEHRTFKTSTGETKEVYNYIWYPIFYDMDTMLGLDNIGYVNKNYYDEDTQEDVFNGDEILWKFVRDALKNDIGQFYTRLETSNSILTKNSILPFFNQNQANVANETFYNEDAFYKYIDTFRNGYFDHLHNVPIEAGTGERLYAAQGDRAMMREWFIENRIKYLRGKYQSENYQEADRIEFRLTYPKIDDSQNAEEQAKVSASIKAVPPTGDFTFTAARTGFAGVKVGTASDNRRFWVPTDENEVSPTQTQTLKVDTTSGSGTETYLFGISSLSDVGDLSDKYLYKLIVKTDENNLRRLILGNHHKDYYNKYWSEESSIDLVGFKYLEEFNLENCSTFTGKISFADSPRIKTILLNGSGTTSVTLPPNGVIEELRMPPSVKTLKIDSHPGLQKEKFTLGYFDYDTNTYVDNFSQLTHVSVKNTPIDTYKLVRETVVLPEIVLLQQYCFTDVNWEITNIEDVSVDDNGYIISIKALDKLLTLDYINGDASIKSHADALTGTLTLNISGAKANELAIYEKYINSYPSLKIKYGNNMGEVAKAPAINFYRKALIIKINGSLEIGNIDIDALEPYYTVLVDGKTTTLQAIVENPNFTLPKQSDTLDKTYEFTGQWMDFSDNNQTIYYQEVGYTDDDADKSKPFTTFIPQNDMYLIPIFKEQDRVYTVDFWDSDNNNIASLGMFYEQTFDKDFYPFIEYWHRDDDDKLSEHERYGFRGWIGEADYLKVQDNSNYKPVIYDLSTLKVTDDMDLYAYYEIEDARYVVSNLNLFVFSPITIDGESGYKISSVDSSDNYYRGVAGKITLPDTYNGKKVLSIGSFERNDQIKAVYFLNVDKCSYKRIEDNGGFGTNGLLGSYVNLEKIYLPETITHIGSNAFCNCQHLILEKLPNSTKTIASQAFLGCEKINIDTIIGVQTIGTYALSRTSSNVTSLTLDSSIISIGNQAFSNAYQNVQNVYNNTTYSADDLISFGLPATATYHGSEGV